MGVVLFLHLIRVCITDSLVLFFITDHFTHACSKACASINRHLDLSVAQITFSLCSLKLNSTLTVFSFYFHKRDF